MRKKVVSVVVTICLTVVSVFCYPMQNVNAVGSQIDSEKVLDMLNEITVAGQDWKGYFILCRGGSQYE